MFTRHVRNTSIHDQPRRSLTDCEKHTRGHRFTPKVASEGASQAFVSERPGSHHVVLVRVRLVKACGTGLLVNPLAWLIPLDNRKKGPQSAFMLPYVALHAALRRTHLYTTVVHAKTG